MFPKAVVVDQLPVFDQLPHRPFFSWPVILRPNAAMAKTLADMMVDIKVPLGT